MIKEEERGTDMIGFEEYLEFINGPKNAVAEIQTEVKQRKNIKLGVNPEKMGLQRDKETITDERLLL